MIPARSSETPRTETPARPADALQRAERRARARDRAWVERRRAEMAAAARQEQREQ